MDLVEQPFLAQTFSVTVELMAQTAFYESILEVASLERPDSQY